MITVCNGVEAATQFEQTLDSEHVAKTFLQGERSLAALHGNDELAALLDGFLEDAGDTPLRIEQHDDTIRLRTADDSRCLELTGRTADVVRNYLRGEEVSIADRMDMTMRRR